MFGAINLVSLPILISEIKTKEDVILPQNTDFWSILKLLELIKVHTFFFVLRGYKIFSYIKKMKYIYVSILTPIDTQYKHCSFLSYLRLPRYDVATVRLFTASTRLVAFAAFKRKKKNLKLKLTGHKGLCSSLQPLGKTDIIQPSVTRE